jgi:hypothetical protein
MSFVLKPNRFANRRIVTPGNYYSVETLIRSNTNYDRAHEHYVYMDQFFLILDRNLYTTYVGGTFLGNIDLMLKTLPQDQSISSGTVWSLLVSAFGNAAKKKLRELSTPKAILAWMESSPTEVANLMGITLLPIRTAEMFAAYKLANGFKTEPADVATGPVTTEEAQAPVSMPKRVRRGDVIGTPIPAYVIDAVDAITGVTLATTTSTTSLTAAS